MSNIWEILRTSLAFFLSLSFSRLDFTSNQLNFRLSYNNHARRSSTSSTNNTMAQIMNDIIQYPNEYLHFPNRHYTVAARFCFLLSVYDYPKLTLWPSDCLIMAQQMCRTAAVWKYSSTKAKKACALFWNSYEVTPFESSDCHSTFIFLSIDCRWRERESEEDEEAGGDRQAQIVNCLSPPTTYDRIIKRLIQRCNLFKYWNSSTAD